MSFFAVLRPTTGASFPAVVDCHLNLWCLGALGPRRTLVLDIGLRLRADDGPIDSVRLALPFGTSQVTDLAGKVLDSQIAELIFDTEVLLPSSDTIRYRDRDLRISHVATARAKRESEYAESYFSVWNLPLVRPIPEAEESYLRIRFNVVSSGRTWQWQRRWRLCTGAIIDFRICDIRSTATVPGGEELRHAILPISRIAAFVMVPAWLYARASSPAPAYVRLLEGSVWTEYLDRAPEVRSSSKLVVYTWRNYRSTQLPHGEVGISAGAPEPTTISIDKPFRIFLHLAKETGPLSPLRVIFLCLVAIGLADLIFDIDVRHGWSDIARSVGHGLHGIPGWLQLTTGGGIVTFVLARRIAAIASLVGRLKRHLLAIEETIFRKLSK
jgi:hypothetical protein